MHQYNDSSDHSAAISLDEGTLTVIQTAQLTIHDDDDDDVSISLPIHNHHQQQHTDAIVPRVDECNGHAFDDDVDDDDDLSSVVDERGSSSSRSSSRSSSMKDDSHGIDVVGDSLSSNVGPQSSSFSSSSSSLIVSKVLTDDDNLTEYDDDNLTDDDNVIYNDDGNLTDDDDHDNLTDDDYNNVIDDDNDVKVPVIDKITALRYALNDELSRSSAMGIRLELLLIQINDHSNKIREALNAIPKLL